MLLGKGLHEIRETTHQMVRKGLAYLSLLPGVSLFISRRSEGRASMQNICAQPGTVANARRFFSTTIRKVARDYSTMLPYTAAGYSVAVLNCRQGGRVGSYRRHPGIYLPRTFIFVRKCYLWFALWTITVRRKHNLLYRIQ